jgi:LmbE family N-acetylglucosaminyl deacetylase
VSQTLIVVAHPDDEVLGCGGLAAALARSGQTVRVCILSGSAEARLHRPDIAQLHAQARKALHILGLPEPLLGPFPNIAFNTVPHLELVQFIEGMMRETGAARIYTHHPADLNDDHRHTSHACQAAARLSQRDSSVPPLERLAYMEILSSTDWSFPSDAKPFAPNAFFELGEELLALKLQSLATYEGVMRPFPHPRSDEVVRGLAAYRGGQAGCRYAEAFQIAFERLRTT